MSTPCDATDHIPVVDCILVDHDRENPAEWFKSTKHWPEENPP